jgi:DNA (cytosine-5)-methyltransferase 1
MKKINLLDLFSGIGGFHLGLERAGFKVSSFNSEIDKYAIEVYKHNFKQSKYVGSVTDVRGSELPRIDAITFGSPCQDFSLAGNRKGMAGERSSLILEAIRLIQECRPRFFVWENVKGTFSSNNREDFAAILQAFANIGGYRLEWQLLNTKWFLPQSRERVYLVGYTPKGSRGQIFPITESAFDTQRLAGEREESACITTSYHKGMNYDNQLIAASRGRNPNDLNDRQAGSPMQQRLEINKEGISNTLTSVHKDNYVVGNQQTIRRLTPIECERLQGFPDNWTLANGISDTQRYKMCGNAVTVDVVEAVGKRILETVYGSTSTSR